MRFALIAVTAASSARAATNVANRAYGNNNECSAGHFAVPVVSTPAREEELSFLQVKVLVRRRSGGGVDAQEFVEAEASSASYHLQRHLPRRGPTQDDRSATPQAAGVGGNIASGAASRGGTSSPDGSRALQTGSSVRESLTKQWNKEPISFFSSLHGSLQKAMATSSDDTLTHMVLFLLLVLVQFALFALFSLVRSAEQGAEPAAAGLLKRWCPCLPWPEPAAAGLLRQPTSQQAEQRPGTGSIAGRGDGRVRGGSPSVASLGVGSRPDGIPCPSSAHGRSSAAATANAAAGANVRTVGVQGALSAADDADTHETHFFAVIS